MIYLDNAATTPMSVEVVEAMKPYFTRSFANPASLYDFACDVKRDVEKARKILANVIGAKASEIYFTSGGTESDNWAIKGIAEKHSHKGKHIITTSIEHHAVLHTCQWLEKQGYEVTYLPVDEYGMVNLNDVEKAIRTDTILISVMYANNEIGTIQPITEIGEIAKKHGIIFHTDAVQAYTHFPINVKRDNIDLLSVSGHKFGGPKGVGFLYIRNEIDMDSFIHGGGQEDGIRAGTTNVSGIIGMAKAAEIAMKTFATNMTYIEFLRNNLVNKILHEVPNVKLNGHPTRRLGGNASLCFDGIEGEALLILLNMDGICVSAGSACNAGSKETSHVLKAIGRTNDEASSTVRITIGCENTLDEIHKVAEKIRESVARLREMV